MGGWIPFKCNLLSLDRDVGVQLIPAVLASHSKLDMLLINIQTTRDHREEVSFNQVQHLWIDFHTILYQHDLQSFFGKLSRSRSEEHTSELQSLAYLVCRLLLEKKK